MSALMYLIFSDFREYIFLKNAKRVEKKYGPDIVEDLYKIYTGKKVEEERINEVSKRLKKRTYEKTFNKILIEFTVIINSRDVVKAYMEHFEPYVRKRMRKYRRKGSVLNVQTTYLLGEYGLDKTWVLDYIMQGLDSDSIYLRFNSISALSKIGNSNEFVQGLKRLSHKESFINQKVIIDVLDHFEGSKEDLNNLLVENLNGFSEEIQVIIIDFFRNQKDDFPANYLVNYLMEEGTGKEVKASIIKYLECVVEASANQALYGLLKSDQWELRALSSKALGAYSHSDTIVELFQTLSDDNWHVRLNSAKSLLNILVKYGFDPKAGVESLIEIVQDRYGIDVMYYAMNELGYINYDMYEKYKNEGREYIS